MDYGSNKKDLIIGAATGYRLIRGFKTIYNYSI